MCAYMAILFQHISCTHSIPNSFSLEREAKLHCISTIPQRAAAAMEFTAPPPPPKKNTYAIHPLFLIGVHMFMYRQSISKC